jgi:hypothetical protein
MADGASASLELRPGGSGLYSELGAVEEARVQALGRCRRTCLTRFLAVPLRRLHLSGRAPPESGGPLESARPLGAKGRLKGRLAASDLGLMPARGRGVDSCRSNGPGWFL